MSKNCRWEFIIFVLFILAAISGSGNLHAQKLEYNGGAGFTTGSYYFSDATQSYFLSTGFSARYSRVRLSVTVPFIIQSSPWISYSPGGGIPTGGAQNGSVRRGGSGSGSGHQGGQGGSGRNQITLPDTVSYSQASFSDPSFQAGLTLLRGSSNTPGIIISGQVKVPVHDPATGFGTGEWDMAAGVSVSQRLGYSWMIFGDATLWWLGDMNDLQLNRSLAYAASIGKMLTGRSWLISAGLVGSTQIIDGYDAPMALTAGGGYTVNEKFFINLAMSAGLSESSPDVSASLGWSYSI